MNCLAAASLFLSSSLITALSVYDDQRSLREQQDFYFIPGEQWEKQGYPDEALALKPALLRYNPTKREIFPSLMGNHDRIRMLKDLRRNERILRMRLNLGK